jgi:GTPase SAR1 family protein
MARRGSQHRESESGILILGNAGSGKSFMCNVLIDSPRFESNFSAKAVTLETEYHTITVDGNDLSIYNMPGLIERKQDRIDENKKEIIKAFNQCPNSIVIFVWTSHTGGRVQSNDLIAFGALYKAYEFQPKSLIYVVNKVPHKDNNSKFQSEFLTEIQEGLQEEEGLNVDPKDVVFIEEMDFNNKEQRTGERMKLFDCIKKHCPAVHKKKADIILQADQLIKMRETIQRHQAEAEKDRKTYERKLKEMRETIRSHRAEAKNDRKTYESKSKETGTELKETEHGRNSNTLSDVFLEGFRDGVRVGATATGVLTGTIGALTPSTRPGTGCFGTSVSKDLPPTNGRFNGGCW